MTNIVSFHNVPMPRGLAFAINHIEEHGAPVTIFSADRTARALAIHNRQYGTNLHSQAWLIAMHEVDPAHYAAANPITMTSHCYYSDGNWMYKRPAGARIPWFMLGIDMSDRGRVENVSHFLGVAKHLGYKVGQPYAAGSERHHVIFTESPIKRLESWNVIARVRHA